MKTSNKFVGIAHAKQKLQRTLSQRIRMVLISKLVLISKQGIGGQGGIRLTCGIIVVEERDKLAKEGKILLIINFSSTQEEAAEAYDVAAIKFRGLSAVTNFDRSKYDVKSILESTTLPIGGAAKRFEDMEQVELGVDGYRDQEDHSIMNSHITQRISNNYGGATTHHNWHNALAFHQLQLGNNSTIISFTQIQGCTL